MNEYFTWELLGTFAGAVLAVTLLVQLLKLPIDKVVMKLFGKDCRIPTRLIVYIMALAIVVAVEAAKGTLTWPSLGLCVLNAALVTISAMGAYELTFAKTDAKKIDSKVT